MVNEESIIHQAVGILRKRISNTEKVNDEYFSPNETTLEAQRNFVDPLVYKFVGWLMNEQKYKNGEDIENDVRCLSIACDLTTLSSSIFSPKHLNLALYLHHNFGSRKLIDATNALGYCISYTELRKFITSAAIHIDQQQQVSEVPPELVPINKVVQMILAGADDWDHNKHMLDGKRVHME